MTSSLIAVCKTWLEQWGLSFFMVMATYMWRRHERDFFCLSGSVLVLLLSPLWQCQIYCSQILDFWVKLGLQVFDQRAMLHQWGCSMEVVAHCFNKWIIWLKHLLNEHIWLFCFVLFCLFLLFFWILVIIISIYFLCCDSILYYFKNYS